jgi:hypothetical protein
MATITISGTPFLDQSSALTDGHTATDSVLSGLSPAFQTFLNSMAGDLALSGRRQHFGMRPDAFA